MKRFVALLLVLALLFSLTGCGGNTRTHDPDGPIELIIWHDKEAAVADTLQAELDRLQPDIVVHLERKAGLTEALKMVTVNAAYAAFLEDTKGSIEVGKDGDFTIIDRDPYLYEDKQELFEPCEVILQLEIATGEVKLEDLLVDIESGIDDVLRVFDLTHTCKYVLGNF